MGRPTRGSPLTGRAWYQNVNELAYIGTANTILDGTYDFRIVGYRALGGGGWIRVPMRALER